MASVRKVNPKDPASPWVCEYTDANGKRRRYTPKTGLKKDADAYRRKIEGELERGEHVAAAASMSLSAAADAFLRDCHARAAIDDHMTKSTVAMYATCLGRISHDLGKRMLPAINGDVLQDFADDLTERLSPVSVKHSFMAIGLVFDFAKSKGWIKRNPIRDYRIRLPARRRTTQIPSKDQIKALLKCAAVSGKGERPRSKYLRTGMIVLAVFCGLRRGEICGLKWEHVDFAKGAIRVRHSLSRLDGLKSPKSKAGVRSVPMSPPVVAALQALHVQCGAPAEGYVFTSREGEPIQPLDLTNIYWRKLAERAGLANDDGTPLFRFHSLRHAAASLLIDQGLSALHLKTVIGHASVRTTLDIYGHLFPDDDAISSAATKIASTFVATETRLEQITR